MIKLDPVIIIMFALYLLAMLGIGVYFYFKTKDLSDYVLGGRQLNGWVTPLSAQASDMSGWLLMGLPGAAYISGFDSIWIAVGLGVGTYLNWKIVAKRLRIYTQFAGDSITIPDYFENRFNDKSKVLRVISALFILIFFLFYTASGFVAGGKLFSGIFGISYLTALTIGAVVIVGYTFLGGFMAVCWTDFFQGMLMFFAIVIVPVVGIFKLGGIGPTFDYIRDFNPNMLNPFTDSKGVALSAVAVISSLAWGLGYFGQPHILVRFMGIKDHREIKKSRIIAMVWVVISLIAAVLVGIIGIPLIDPQLSVAKSETVFIILVSRTFNSVIAGLLLAAVLAAIMSTADSQLLVTASSLTEDFYKVLFRKNASDKELVFVSRLSVMVVAVIAYIIARDENSSILKIVSYAWAGFGATFGPTIIISLFWKYMTRNAALLGMIVGGVTTIVWEKLSGGIFDIYEIVPGFLFSFITIIVVSKLGKEPEKDVLDTFDKVEIENR